MPRSCSGRSSSRQSKSPLMSDELPEAQRVRRRGLSIAWILPLLALVAAALLLWQVFAESGTGIRVSFDEGHGLKPGDPIKHRGIVVGVVDEVNLSSDLGGVSVEARLHPSASGLAREGSRFWIVRPQLGLAGASGLETVVGAKYIGVVPGPEGSPAQDLFDGAEAPPLVETKDEGGLEILVSTPDASGLRPGAPVTYRQVQVGKVLSTGLSRDASEVEATLYIDPGYAVLIRENTRFWKTSGVNVRAGLVRGVEFNVESMSSLLLGGVGLATPPEPGVEAKDGQRFVLAPEARPEWQAWSPRLPLRGGLPDAPAAGQPEPLPTVLRWKAKNLIGRKRERERRGWVLPVGDRLIGPASLLGMPDDAAKGENVSVEIGGRALPIASEMEREGRLLMRPLPAGVPQQHVSTRAATEPERLLVISGSEAANRLVAVDLIQAEDHQEGPTTWLIDRVVTFQDTWHGAPVLADRDKTMIGFLLLDGRDARVQLWTGEDSP